MAEDSRTRIDPVVKFINFIATFIFVCILILAILQIFFRFILRISVPWTEELIRVLYVYVTFLGLILLEAEDNNIKAAFMIDKLPFKQRYIIQIFINIFSVFFLICMFIGAIIMFRSSNTMNFGTMPFLKVSVLYIPIIICCPLTTFYLVKQLFNFQIKEIKQEDQNTLQDTNCITGDGIK